MREPARTWPARTWPARARGAEAPCAGARGVLRRPTLGAPERTIVSGREALSQPPMHGGTRRQGE